MKSNRPIFLRKPARSTRLDPLLAIILGAALGYLAALFI